MPTKTTQRHPQVEALRDGLKNRSAVFRPLKGKGSYRRKGKHQ
jgi:stalled ribosome alternative rescue factor ArfA